MTTQLVTTDDAVRALADRLGRERRIAFDTEAASFHKYNDRVYLVQVSSERETAVVDPLAVKDLEPLGRLLASPDVEVIFHDADYDLRSLDRDYSFRARRVFDTRIAAQLLGEPGVGLGALLLKYFGVTLNKKLQRADWSLRPLTQEMIDYAASDTTHLPALRDKLEDELRKLGRLRWAEEEFERLEAIRWTGTDASPDNYIRLKGAKTLPPQTQLVLRGLYGWRDDRARAMDRASFRVLQNEALMALAQAAPRDIVALKATPGVPTSAIERFGGELLDVIAKALATPVVDGPRRERVARSRPDAETEARFERLKQMRNDRAKEMGIEPGVLCSNAALQTLARVAGGLQPDADQGEGAVELRRWQREALGENRIQAALAGPAQKETA